jgi:hypothetical protein
MRFAPGCGRNDIAADTALQQVRAFCRLKSETNKRLGVAFVEIQISIAALLRHIAPVDDRQKHRGQLSSVASTIGCNAS